jgi:ATP-dependent DNA helicase RecQ
LLSYFGEYFEKDCGFCDNCQKTTEKLKVQKEVELVLSAVQQTEERFAAVHIADLLTSTDNQYVKSYEHDKLDVFGKGLEINDSHSYWISIIRQLVIFNYLEKDVENYGIMKMSTKGKEYLIDPYPITLHKDHNFDEEEVKPEDDDKDMAGGSAHAYDEALLGMLKALRKKVAKEKNLPPYVIFQDPSMEEMATTYPTTQQEMAQINGVGMGKVQKFGRQFIDLIKRYVDENEIETAQDVVIKSTVNKSKIKIYIIQQVDRKISLDEIAESKNLSLAEIIEEIEHICYSGTKLNLDYYINQVVDRERQQDIFEYFMTSETDNIAAATNEFSDDEVSEEELRLMRIKFLSELAN